MKCVHACTKERQLETSQNTEAHYHHHLPKRVISVDDVNNT